MFQVQSRNTFSSFGQFSIKTDCVFLVFRISLIGCRYDQTDFSHPFTGHSCPDEIISIFVEKIIYARNLDGCVPDQQNSRRF